MLLVAVRGEHTSTTVPGAADGGRSRSDRLLGSPRGLWLGPVLPGVGAARLDGCWKYVRAHDYFPRSGSLHKVQKVPGPCARPNNVSA